MRTRCPSCGAENSLDSLVSHDAARAALESALSLHPLGKLIYKYLALFRPAKRSLSWDRVASLLEDLLPQIEAAQITWEGQTYAVPRDAWAAGIQVVLDMRQQGKLQTPLDGHNLLRSVLARRSQASQSRAAERAELDLDAQRRHNPELARQKAYGDSSGAASALSELVAKKREHLAGLYHMHNLKPSQRTAELLGTAKAELEALLQQQEESADVVPD